MTIPKKIGIIGTHGTRKSTLVHLLTGKLKEQGINTGYLSEVASSCPLPINQKSTLKAQFWIMLTQIKREIELENRPYDYLVLDRCVLDNYVYMRRAHDLLGKSSTDEDDNLMQLGTNLMERWVPTYSHLFKVDIPKGSLVDDGIRDVSSDFQQDIELRMDALFDTLGISNLHHISGSNEARLQEIMNILNHHKTHSTP